MIFLVVIHIASEHFFSVFSQRQEVTFQWDVDDVHIDGVMVSMHAMSVVDHGLSPVSIK